MVHGANRMEIVQMTNVDRLLWEASILLAITNYKFDVANLEETQNEIKRLTEELWSTS